MKWVRLEGGRVYESIPEAASVPDVAHWYGEAFAAQCVEAPDEVRQGWVYDARTLSWSEPPAAEEPVPDTPDYTQFVAGMMEGYGI